MTKFCGKRPFDPESLGTVRSAIGKLNEDGIVTTYNIQTGKMCVWGEDPAAIKKAKKVLEPLLPRGGRLARE